MTSITAFLAQDGFTDVLAACVNDSGLIAQVDRLLGCSIGKSLASEQQASEEDLAKLICFVDEFVYQPLVAKFVATGDQS